MAICSPKVCGSWPQQGLALSLVFLKFVQTSTVDRDYVYWNVSTQ